MKRITALILILSFVCSLTTFAYDISKNDYTPGEVLFTSDFEIYNDGEQPTGNGNTNEVCPPEWINVPSSTGGGVVEDEISGNKYYRFYNDTNANVTANFIQYFNMTLQDIKAMKIEYDVRTMGVAFYSRWRDNVGSQNTFFMNLSRNSGDVFSKNIQPEVWNHFEVIIDDNKNLMQVWVNGILATEELFQQVYTKNKTICTLTFSATLFPGDEAFLDNVKITKLIPGYDESQAVVQGTVQKTEIEYKPSENGMPLIGEQIELGEPAFNETSTQIGGGLTKLGHRTYVSMNAKPSYFNEYDTLTGQYIRSFPVNESSFYYAFQVGSDGMLYHSGGPEVYQYDPETKINKKIESYITDATGTSWGMNLGVSGDNTKLYNAHWIGKYYKEGKGMPVAEYDVLTGKTNVYYGVGGELKYTHAATGNEDYIFCSGGDDAGSERLIRVDKKTGEQLIWYNTDPEIVSGNMGQCILVGDKLFTRIRAWSFCIDIDTMTEFARFQSGTRGGRQSVSYPRPGGDPNIVYYPMPNDIGLMEFNIQTGESKENVIYENPVSELGKMEFGQWIQKKDGTWAIYACVKDTHVALITPGDPHVEYIELKAPSLGFGTTVQPNYYHITRDDMLYVGGYRAGINGFDLKTKTPVFSVKQNSQHGISEANGMIFCGTYSSGAFYMIDPEKPVVFDSGNPKYIFTSEYGCRHYNVSGTNAGFCMHSGIADYGQPEGSVIMSTYADGEPKVKEYGGIAPGENITGMCYKDGYIYAGSSVMVNLQEPHAEARIVKLDARTGEVVLEKTYEIEGLPKIGTYGEMAFGPDGNIYVIANEGVTLMVVEPENLELLRYKSYAKQRENGASVVSPWIRFGAEGVLYTNMGEQLFSVNIETLESVLLWGNCDRFAIDNDGNILKRRGGNSTGTILVAMQVDQRQRLDIMIRNAEKYYKEEDYSKVSWKMFENALSDAKKIDLKKSTDEEVKAAARKLSFAIFDLQTKYDEEAGFAYIFGGNPAAFDDMKGYDAETLKAVNTLKHSKIISGLSNKLFAPEKAITRAEFVKLLAVIEGCDDEITEAHEFTDVSKDSWYYDYVQVAYKNGWIEGKSSTEFAPEDIITREQMIIILNRIKPDSFAQGEAVETTRAEAAKLLYDYMNI